MARFTKANGPKKVTEKEKELKSGKMAANTLVTGNLIKLTVKED